MYDTVSSIDSGCVTDAFGDVLEKGNSGYLYEHSTDPQPYHLTTKEYDPDSRLYYFHARWYDPETGRFISASPIRREHEHPYVFCEDSPVNSVDPSGLCFIPPDVFRSPRLADLIEGQGKQTFDKDQCECEKYYIKLCWRKQREGSLRKSYRNGHCGQAALILYDDLWKCLDHYGITLQCCELGTGSMGFLSGIVYGDYRGAWSCLATWFPNPYQNVVTFQCRDGTAWYFDVLYGHGDLPGW